MRPGLTLIVMVKDDAERLKRCLESAKSAVDEILVLDTGSKDNSIEVAKSAGARVYEHPWPDAYDIAINHLIEKVETEWILRLDSDEWLEPNQEMNVRNLMTNPEAFAYLLTRKDQLPNNVVSEMTMIRMWRNHPKMRYLGTVHENFPPETLSEVSDGRFILDSSVNFGHDGYKFGVTKEKHERNWELLHKELKLRPGNLYYEIHLAEAYCQRNPKTGWDAVKKLTKKASQDESDDSPEDALSMLFSRYFNLLPDEELFTELTDAIILRSWRWFGKFPEVVWAISIVQLRRDDRWATFNALMQLEYLSESGSYSRFGHFDPAFLTHGLWQNLAQAAHRVEKREVAIRNYKKLLQVYPNHSGILQNLKNLGAT